MKTLPLIIAAIAATCMPAVANADANRIAVSSAVSYKDLDLSNDAGRQRLDRRLAAAVRNVCGSYYGRQSLTEAMQYARCRNEALATAATGRQLAMASGARRTGVALAVTPEIGK